jgi:hypothetical protein
VCVCDESEGASGSGKEERKEDLDESEKVKRFANVISELIEINRNE